MTGERRKKIQSVLLTAIMVLSVMAMGMAGFAGSAAAASQSDTNLSDGQGVAFADPANAGESGEHTIVVQLDDSLGTLGDGPATNLSISYNNPVDMSALGNISGSSAGEGADLSSNDQINIFVNDTALTAANVTFENGTDTVEINVTDLNEDASDQPTFELNSSDQITIELGAGANDLINPSGDTDVDVTVGDTNGNTLDFTGLTMAIGSGPIEVDQSGTTIFFNTFHKAVANLSNTGDTLTVTEDLDETLPTSIDTSASPGSSGVTIEGSGSPVINVTGYTTDVIDFGGTNNVTVQDLTLESSSNSNSAITTGSTANSTISSLTFENFQGTTIDASGGLANTTGPESFDVSSNTFTGDSGGAIDVDASAYGSGDTLTIDSNTVTQTGGTDAIALTGGTNGGPIGQADITSNDIEGGEGSSVGISLNTGNDVDVDGGSINATQGGINTTGGGNAGEFLNISNVGLTNIANTGITAQDNATSTAVNIDGVTIDSSSSATGILITNGGTAPASVDIDNADINATNVGVDFADGSTGTKDLNLTSSTISNAGTAGLQFSGNGDDLDTRVHFNTFDSNAIAVDVNADIADGTNGRFANLTFNDFTNSDSAALDTDTAGQTDSINANYSYWGAPTGPANGGSTQDAFGDGDSVTLSSSSDATVYPFLTEETGSLISDSQQSGSQLIVLPDPERPIGSANDDNTALVGVANLNGSVGASNPDLFAPSADSQPTAAQSFSGTLSPSNIAQFEVNLSSPGTIDVQGVADGASSNTVQQTYTGQSDSITFSANKSVVSTDVGAEITAQAVDSNGNPVERQGLNVRFAEDSGFNDAGVTLSASDGNTSNNGTATTIVQDAGSLSPGQEFTVLANIDGNVERANFSTAAGEIDATASTLRLNDSTNDFGDLQVDSTVDVSAEILDANQNPLEGRTVEFASNGTVEFGSDSVDTNSDGFANTTVTVDTETQGVVAINATVGNFNTTSTSDAQRNITTIAGDATQLGFASDSRSMAPGASLNPTVQVQDEFGNFNDTASVNNGISVTSSDTNVISVSGVDDLSGNSDQFTLSAESGGEATITVSSDDSDISGVNDTFVVSDPAAIDLSVAHNVATVSANNSNANTQNQALVTAQFTDSDGSALGVANENISFGLSGSSAELNQSDVTTKSTDGDGNVTILVNGTDTTGTSTIVATAENFTSINRGETTVTTTGSASGISLSPENDTIAQNDEINVTAEFVDDEGRNVPRLTDVSLSADDGNVTTGTTATAPNDDGAVVSTFTYNSSGASESVTITATGGGLFGETTVTIEEQDQESASVTFNDQSVQNGTEEVTVASANYTLADGSEGDYVVVMHVVNDDGSISSPVGASSDQTGSASDITVDLNDTSAAFEDGDALDTLTENTTLRAMLHETSNDSAFGPSLGLATDDADITVTPESPIDGPAGDFDTDADGDISIGELGDAGEAFAQGELTIAELGAVGQQFAS